MIIEFFASVIKEFLQVTPVLSNEFVKSKESDENFNVTHPEVKAVYAESSLYALAVIPIYKISEWTGVQSLPKFLV